MSNILKGYIDKVTYVLKLEDDRYYVGLTTNLKRRYQQHCDGKGAKWTQLYSPVEIIELQSGDVENELTSKYIAKYGYGNVRGGDYCQLQDLTYRQALRQQKRVRKREGKTSSNALSVNDINKMFGVNQPESAQTKLTKSEQRKQARKARKQRRENHMRKLVEKKLRKELYEEIKQQVLNDLNITTD